MRRNGTTGPRSDVSGRAYAGSQRLIQHYVNIETDSLNRAIEGTFGCQFGPRWVSPHESDGYREYKDREFLTATGPCHSQNHLSEFWPNGGPRWDALASVESGGGGVLLVEAKSHIPEMYAGKCKATSAISLQMIDSSISRAKNWLAVDNAINWLGQYHYSYKGQMRSGSLYQMANRIAHLYFLREILGINAWFVNLCFIDDPHSPTAQTEWNLGLAEAKKNMGIAAVPFAADVFLPA